MTLHELYTPSGSDPHTTAPTSTLKNLRLAWVGDGNNILHSLMLQLPKVGMHITMATPKGYEPNAEILKQAQKNAQVHGTDLEVYHDPKDALRNADIIVTDTWYVLLFSVHFSPNCSIVYHNHAHRLTQYHFHLLAT